MQFDGKKNDLSTSSKGRRVKIKNSEKAGKVEIQAKR
ncbi:hypothetical protein EM595_2787 [Duffyella gerundensis]|uniref:Uncharacterized protein n=1 Tax=Duffyella gerundensis TaxID=1619313 RepID=A0A0U5L2M5_9GAMM|nr:hypothetical protein EM595_2787 [Duffyella gerundensis]